MQKNTLIALCQNGAIVVKNLQNIFWQSGQIRLSYYFNIGYGPNIKFRIFFRGGGPYIFSDFGTQIGQQHFFIIWQDGQTLNQLFFTNVYPNGPTGKSLYPIFVIFGQWLTLANP